MNKSKILRVAGYSLAGFIAVSIGVDRANIGPMAQQVAGFCGAFVGAIAAQRKKAEKSSEEHSVEDRQD